MLASSTGLHSCWAQPLGTTRLRRTHFLLSDGEQPPRHGRGLRCSLVVGHKVEPAVRLDVVPEQRRGLVVGYAGLLQRRFSGPLGAVPDER